LHHKGLKEYSYSVSNLLPFGNVAVAMQYQRSLKLKVSQGHLEKVKVVIRQKTSKGHLN
jgi:hypothetical protein